MRSITNSIFKVFCIILLSINAQLMLAQYEDLQKDKNIIWIAEFSNFYTFSLNESDEQQTIKLIKFNGDASNFSDANNSNWIVNWLFNNAIEGHYKCFTNSTLTQPLSTKEINSIITSIDTVITYDPATYEEQIVIINRQLSIKDIKGIKVNQIIYYDQKRKDFNTRIISVAPATVSKIGNAKKSSTLIKPLFWIKMNSVLPKKFKMKSSDINWAALIFSKNSPIDFNSIKTVKTNYGFDVKKRLYEQAFEFEKPITRTYSDNNKLKIEDLNFMHSKVDTIITFNPDTYEEQVQIIRNELTADDIYNISLTQEWYFDKKKKCLMNQLKAISPTIAAKNNNGNFAFWKPLYYMKYD